jgi:hypothetical protein
MRESILTAIAGSFTLFALFFPATVLAADNYQCSNGSLVRRIEIIYEPGRAVPCEVHYYKDTESPGDRQVLWRAQNEAGYCESKTKAFIEQLESQGFSCGSVADDMAEPAAEEPLESHDDTDALAPAQDNN